MLGGSGTCCLGEQKSPPGRPVLLLSMKEVPSHPCDHHPEEGTAPRARPPPPRQTTSLGPGDQPSAERELEPGSNSWPHSSVPKGPPPCSQAPISARSQAAPHPPKCAARDEVGRGCEGTTGWEISYSLATGMQDLPSRLCGCPAWPLPRGTPASFYCLCSWAQSPCRTTHTLDDWKTPGAPRQPQGSMGEGSETPTPHQLSKQMHRSVWLPFFLIA